MKFHNHHPNNVHPVHPHFPDPAQICAVLVLYSQVVQCIKVCTLTLKQCIHLFCRDAIFNSWVLRLHCQEILISFVLLGTFYFLALLKYIPPKRNVPPIYLLIKHSHSSGSKYFSRCLYKGWCIKNETHV